MKRLLIINTIIIFSLSALNVYGQGIIKGLVSDSLSSEQLKGAEIILNGTNFSTVSNVDGEFNISGIPAGDYILQASYLGYKEKKILVTIKPEKPLTLNIKLLPVSTIENKTHSIDQAKSQAEEINLETSSNTIKNVIADKKLQDMPDENIPVALSRLPGVSIMYNSVQVPYAVTSGDYNIGGISPGPYLPIIPLSDFTIPVDPAARILIRGMDSKYYNVTIDGIRIPPAADKSIDLNNLSGRDFQNIEIHKTITSDEDADATAGAINMISGKAPHKRMIKVEALGNYNRLDKSARQYNFTGRYGERFFNNKLGILANAHIEKKIMSNEAQNSFYDYQYFNSSYTNAVRNMYGANIILDYMTPDGGSITFHNIFNKTNTNNLKSETAISSLMQPEFNYTDRETEQELLLSSLAGSNHVFGFDVDWNAAFFESRDDHPYDYSLCFTESHNPFTGVLLGDALDHALNIPTKNYNKEKTVSLDIQKKYTLSNQITGELKLGGKYRINNRSYFENSNLETTNSQVGLSDFQDNPPGERIGLGNYQIPMINEDSLSSWFQSTFSQYDSSDGADINSYEMSQSISAGYIMHTFNFKGSVVFITGLRIENEHNDYYGYYFPNIFGMTGDTDMIFNLVALNNDLPEKTSTFHYNKTTLLPNFQMILKPTGFLNLRLAAYKTLIRPPYIARIPKYFAMSDEIVYSNFHLAYLNMGNPDLKNADVWNYEFQLQCYGKDIGQFSIDVFYKEIKGMVQATNGILLPDLTGVKSLGIDWHNYVSNFPPTFSYNFFSYYNSPKPSRIWGFEIAHQANFRYLPGLLKNIVLNYNFTFLRSETWITDRSNTIVTTNIVGNHTTATTRSYLIDKSEKLSDMPKFFANVNIGYDMDGFSFRISYFYQDKYPMYDNPRNFYNPFIITQVNRNRFSRLDIAVRQQILKHIFINLNLNNITNSKEESLIKNPPGFNQTGPNWKTAQAYRYGMNIDFGVGIEF